MATHILNPEFSGCIMSSWVMSGSEMGAMNVRVSRVGISKHSDITVSDYLIIAN